MILSTSIILLNIDNIERLSENGDFSEYSVNVTLQIEYQLKDGGKTSETVNVVIYVQAFDDVSYSIINVYRVGEIEEEREVWYGIWIKKSTFI